MTHLETIHLTKEDVFTQLGENVQYWSELKAGLKDVLYAINTLKANVLTADEDLSDIPF